MKTLRTAKHAVLPLLVPLAVLAAEPVNTDTQETQAKQRAHSPLVQKVRRATWRYRDINVATSEGWIQGTPCVSGPNSGAMGVHFILPSRVGDGVLKTTEPESLIYEPQPDGTFHLVGVEYIVLAADWAKYNPDGGTPAVDGNLTNYVGEPNRYGLPAFYELHVWAWEHNPNGSFSDWNSRVTCEKQPVE